MAGNNSRMSVASSGYLSVYSVKAGRSPRRKRSANSWAKLFSRSAPEVLSVMLPSLVTETTFNPEKGTIHQQFVMPKFVSD